MNKKGQVGAWAYVFMIGLTIIILALALAPAGKSFIDAAMGTTTADFIVADDCNVVATPTIIQNSTYAKGTSGEIAQLEKNFYSYQAGYLKSLFRMNGYNANFESWVTAGTVYDTYYIKFNEFSKSAYQWGDYVPEDSTVIIATTSGGAFATAVETALVAGLGAVVDESGTCLTTTTTTTIP